MNKLIWNKMSDYQKGSVQHLCFGPEGLCLEDPKGNNSGQFGSHVLDSEEPAMIWGRMTAETWIGENMAVYFSFYASDSEHLVKQVADVWGTGGIPEGALEVRNPRDLLLHTLQGRYLWFGIRMWGNGEQSPCIGMIRIFYPKEVWNGYLPEIYQGVGQEFLERFLSIFQVIYEDMDQKIRQNSSYLDLQAAQGPMLLWLAEWIGMEHSHLWEEGRLRQYLAEGAACYGKRGTARELIRMIEIFTGEHPYLVEADRQHNPNWFTILLREQVIGDTVSYRTVKRLIEEGKPADMQVRLIPLRPYLFLDQDTYLGINSQLNHYGEARIGAESAFDFTVMGGAEDEKPDIHTF